VNDGDIMTTTSLGRYRLLKQIGKGGMGEVWLGEDPRLHRQVAIKTLPAQKQQDNEFLLRFEREARAAAALNHPHILPIHDFGKQNLPDDEFIAYIVMPYITGGTLADRIEAHNANQTLMPQQEVLAYLIQAAEAIDYAHKHGIIHRDIKPANMLLRNDNWLLLGDFGIARVLSNTENLTRTGVGTGTPEYIAPEQAQGRAEASSDIYSLAVLAYYLFTGRVPFKAISSYGTIVQHQRHQRRDRSIQPSRSNKSRRYYTVSPNSQPNDPARPARWWKSYDRLRATYRSLVPHRSFHDKPCTARPQARSHTRSSRHITNCPSPDNLTHLHSGRTASHLKRDRHLN
jgi:serine/threonine protein kinase